MADDRPPANPLLEQHLDRRAATPAQHACKHENFAAQVNIARLLDTGRFMAEVTVLCAQCDLPFEFLGTGAGIAWDRPTTDITGLTLSAPIEPSYVVKLKAGASYAVPPELHGSKH